MNDFPENCSSIVTLQKTELIRKTVDNAYIHENTFNEKYLRARSLFYLSRTLSDTWRCPRLALGKWFRILLQLIHC